MEALRKISRRKKKAAEAGVEEEVQEEPTAPPGPPADMVEMQPVPEETRGVAPSSRKSFKPSFMTTKPSRQQSDDAYQMHLMEQQRGEAVAMDAFRQRISSYRNSQARYRNPMAPGFDYANWKPYGKVRYRNQDAEFHRQAHGLAPYVACIVESACQGVEEQRWAAMTQLHPEEAAAMESLQASRAVSRAASRDRLAMA